MVFNAIRNIYDHLHDDESRDIFTLRLAYSLSFDNKYINSMIEKVSYYSIQNKKAPFRNNVLTLTNDKRLRAGKVVVYGIGEGCQNLLSFLDDIKTELNIVNYCDSNPASHGRIFKDRLVISPIQLLKEHPDCSIIISSVLHQDEITHQLISLGFKESQLFYREFNEETYFRPDVIEPMEDETYIDVGAYDGRTIKEFLKFCGRKYKKIIALEPDESNYIQCSKFLKRENVDRIDLIKKGAWSKQDTLSFSPSDWSSNVNTDGESMINVTTIDSLMGNSSATTIKMDIEGAELEALMGAKNTILKYKPRLLISIYHKPSDIIDIPAFILQQNNDYKLYLRHSRTDSPSDTVLYAI